MDTNKLSKMTMDGLDCLRRAVRDEIEKKARMGYYVITSIDGKTRRIPAVEALQMLRDKEKEKNDQS